MLLAGRLAAMRLKAEMELEPSTPDGEQEAWQEGTAVEETAQSRLVVLDSRGVSPLLSADLLAEMSDDGGGGGSGTVVLLTADASSYTDAEVRVLDSLGGAFVSASPQPLLPSHHL